MNDRTGIIAAIVDQLPLAPFEVLEFVFYYIIS